MRTTVLILMLLSLSACGATITDPLAIGAMMQRCKKIVARSKAPETIGPFRFDGDTAKGTFVQWDMAIRTKWYSLPFT